MQKYIDLLDRSRHAERQKEFEKLLAMPHSTMTIHDKTDPIAIEKLIELYKGMKKP